MTIGYIGLGKMGSNMVERLLETGHGVIAHDKSAKAVESVKQSGAQGASTVKELVNQLDAPRTIWVMVPHAVVDSVLEELAPLLEEKDLVIDGSNSPYRDSMRRARELQEKGLGFLDIGVSGGPRGARTGACLMVGGEKDVYERYTPLFDDLSAPGGYGYMGTSGAGHFVKMVHNGIEYGMMQAIAEGFAIMKCSEFDLDLVKIADVYNHASVIESRLIEWTKTGLEQFGQELDDVTGNASASGEGEWTVKAAQELGIPVGVIDEALEARRASQTHPNYQGKMISMLRNQFGGHSVKDDE